MPIYKSKKTTKDGRCYFFKVPYHDNFNNIKIFVSKKYLTKTEAKDQERKFLTGVKEDKVIPNRMTIGDLWDEFMDYQSDKVRISTKNGYKHTKIHIQCLFNIKCTDFNIHHYEEWKKEMNNKTSLNLVSKNDKLKVLKAMLNWGRKHYEFPFGRTMYLMTRFESPNAVKEEKKIYNPDQFDKFISEETELRYIILWKVLYYCGLRIGEARGLQWKDIDLDKKELWVNKQVQSIDNYCSYFICSLKTESSNRKLPICDTLYDSLLEYYNEVNKFSNFNNDFFIFGNDYGLSPIPYAQARRRKKVIAEKAGIYEIRLHDFRHSCASLLINKGAPIPMVSKYMGHASVTETLNTYTHMLGTDLKSMTDYLTK